jgi:serine/threonine protein kinase
LSFAIDGRYDLVRQLGAGSMGVVHLAHDVFLDRSVAIKLIDPGHASDPTTLERFKKEAQALAKIRHQNVVQVYAFGPHAGSFYFAMEFIEGRSLETAIDAGETVDEVQGVGILTAVASGLAAVHERNLVHRDVKPSNIVIERATGRPVLIDFGLARRRSRSNPRFSITAGTPMYMAPEQATDPDGTKVTFRADIYALACTAYELFTGHAVFEGEDVFTILKGHLKSPPPLLSQRRPDLALLDASFQRALAKDPEARHESASAFVEELALALRKRDEHKKRDTLAPASSVRSAGLPIERVLVLARDEAQVRQLTKVTTRVAAGARRAAAVQHVASAKELLAAFVADPAAIVFIDEESSELGAADLVSAIQRSPGGRSCSILVVSRDWQDLRPQLGAIGVRDVLPKPLLVQMLTQAIERIVARRSLAADSGT